MQELHRSPSTLPPLLRTYCLLSVLLTTAALAAIFACRHLFHLQSYLYSFYVFPHGSDYVDLWGYKARFHLLHSAAFFSPGPNLFTYPPAAAPFYAFFFLFAHSTTVFLLLCGCTLVALDTLFIRALHRRGVSIVAAVAFTLVCTLFSYPLTFEANRANMEILVWLFSATGIYTVLRDRPWLGASLIGIAVAMKLFPFIYLGLLISRRQYRQAIFGVITAGVATLASLWLLDPDIPQSTTNSLHDLGALGNLHEYTRGYIPAIGVDHSLFALLKRCLSVIPSYQFVHTLDMYLAVAAVTGILVYLLRIRHLPSINQVLCLTIACVLLPPTSYDYTLLHLYTPWALCVLFAVDTYHRGRLRVPGLTAIFVCFAILLAQTGEFVLHGDRLGGQIRAAVLLVLFVVALRYPLQTGPLQLPGNAGPS